MTPIAPGALTGSGSLWPPVGSAKPPELITEAAIAMAHADLQRSRDLLKTAVLR